MGRLIGLVAVLVVSAGVAIGCAGDGNPVMPIEGQELVGVSNPARVTNTQLWGLYNVRIDAEDMTAVVVPSRHAMFTVNVVRFMDLPPPKMTIQVLDVVHGPDYLDIDLDVTLRHPFPGYPKYNGYDVRGVFMGDGSGMLEYNSSLNYPVRGTDQYMLDDPANGDGDGGPDGYTRWFNYTEFSTGGMPLFSYTQGDRATPDFDGTATLCPYKYFADGLDSDEDVWGFLTSTDNHGVFSSTAINTRNYYLRFPDETGLEFGYAIIADWEGVEPECHPSNAVEAVACNVIDGSDVFYPDSAGSNGDLILDINLFGWDFQPSKVYIESTVLSAVASFDPADVATGGGEHYSTYHVEIPADNVNDYRNQEFWVIAEYEDFDYSNDFGTSNEAEGDPLAAFFRYDLSVEYTGDFGWARTWGGPSSDQGYAVAADAFGNVYVTGDFRDTVEFDPGGGDPHTSNGALDVFLSKFDSLGNFQWARTWGGSSPDRGSGVAIDGFGDVYVTGYFNGIVDLNPSGGDLRTSNGHEDVFLSKFDSSGNFAWARTWGGSRWDWGRAIAADSFGNVYITGSFRDTVDFDPDGGDPHTSDGENNVFLSKFDSLGNFEWARTWGGVAGIGWGVGADVSGSVFVTGNFWGTADFDPDGGDPHTSNGFEDVFLCKYDSSGSFEWARTWGGPDPDTGLDVAADGAGGVYVTGHFQETVDLDPGGGDPHTSNGLLDVYLSRFDSSGNFQGTRTWGGPYTDSGQGVDVDGFGYVYVTGHFEETVDFNPSGGDSHTSNGHHDVFLSRFDSSGSFEWAQTWGGEWTEDGNGVAADGSGNVYVVGYFSVTVDFAPTDPPCNNDPDEQIAEWSDAFLTKHLPDGCW